MKVVTLQYARLFSSHPMTSNKPLMPWLDVHSLLGVLRTCRQIQREASLLPYMLNTFVPGPGYDRAWVEDDFIFMHGMISRLSDAQRHAIHAIGLPCNGVVYKNEYPSRLPHQIQHSRLFAAYSGYPTPTIPTKTLRDLSEQGLLSCILTGLLQTRSSLMKASFGEVSKRRSIVWGGAM
jgi:hypothetical protein